MNKLFLFAASQSPLGLASGSLTPPPAMGSASNLQMGLMGSANNANRGLINAAPGAEAMSKFRASGMCSCLSIISLSNTVIGLLSLVNMIDTIDNYSIVY